MLADTFLCFKTTPYVGKPRNYHVNQEKCKYYVCGAKEIVNITLITDLEKHTNLERRNISYDHLYYFFYPTKLAARPQYYYSWHITGIPEKVKKISGRQHFYEFFGDGREKLTLHSYMVTAEYEKFCSKKRSNAVHYTANSGNSKR